MKFKQTLAYASIAFAISITCVDQAAAGIIFDNGSFSGSQSLRIVGLGNTMFEQFTVNSAATVTGLEWKQHDRNNATYSSTTFSLFNALPSGGSLIFSGDFVASRTANATGTLYGSFDGFDYEIMGLSLNLSPGTYYFGLYTNGSGYFTWDQTTGTGETIAGRYQSSNPLDPGSFYSGEDSVFQINGLSTVPEPASLTIFGTICLVACGRRRKS
jgi:hypothetical protein